jgi:allantoicase
VQNAGAVVNGGPPGFARLPDLTSRLLGGSVIAATDELFAEKENLIRPGDPVHDPVAFGARGKIYDGWETRRRRDTGHDHAIIRLGIPGVVHGVIVDTRHFRGNYPPEISVEGLRADGYPSAAELAATTWLPLVPRAAAQGDTLNSYQAGRPRLCTHVRLSIYPDGGVARFRVHGRPVANPAFLTGTIDLAALENGGELTECSGEFYSSARNLIMPGRARVLSEGWENARRRGPGKDYAVIRLAGAGRIRRVIVDTTCFVGNAPGSVALHARGPAGSWREILPKTPVQPDTRHVFEAGDGQPATHVRLDVYPDGGLARLRVHGELEPEALAALQAAWEGRAGHARHEPE